MSWRRTNIDLETVYESLKNWCNEKRSTGRGSKVVTSADGRNVRDWAGLIKRTGESELTHCLD